MLVKLQPRYPLTIGNINKLFGLVAANHKGINGYYFGNIAMYNGGSLNQYPMLILETPMSMEATGNPSGVAQGNMVVHQFVFRIVDLLHEDYENDFTLLANGLTRCEQIALEVIDFVNRFLRTTGCFNTSVGISWDWIADTIGADSSNQVYNADGTLGIRLMCKIEGATPITQAQCDNNFNKSAKEIYDELCNLIETA